MHGVWPIDMLDVHCVCLPVCKQGTEKHVGFPRTRDMDSCKLSYACLDLNPGPLQEQQALLNTVLSLQSPHPALCLYIFKKLKTQKRIMLVIHENCP